MILMFKVQEAKRLMGLGAHYVGFEPANCLEWRSAVASEIEANVNLMVTERLPNATPLNSDESLSQMGLYKGHSNTKCVSLSMVA